MLGNGLERVAQRMKYATNGDGLGRESSCKMMDSKMIFNCGNSPLLFWFSFGFFGSLRSRIFRTLETNGDGFAQRMKYATNGDGLERESSPRMVKRPTDLGRFKVARASRFHEMGKIIMASCATA